jgi:outer membrane protein insertion porin family
MKRLVALAAVCFLILPLGARAQFVVADIRVEGLQRISAGTVFNYLPLEVGERVDPEQYPDLVRELFRTGFFTDVNLRREGDVLIITVVERPSISDIELSGNKDISDDDLMAALDQVGLSEGQVFDRSLLDRTEIELRRQYYARGKYAMRIESKVSEGPRNTVSIELDISEGEVARIKQIRIIGNQAFEEDELLDALELTTPGWLTWLTKRDRYSKPQLTADLESLRSYYLDRGYLKFTVNSTQVSITPDRRDIYITINITEGEPFTITDVQLAGELPVDAATLSGLISVESGQTFSRAKATETAQRISDRLGDDGYAFANVNLVPDLNEETREVALTLFVDPGRRVYVRRINFSGNSRTYDEVLRREMRQMEGAWFSTTKVDRSRTRLERLGYFDEVNVETPPVPGVTDQVDVNYAVTERASGNLVLGAGFSQASGPVLNVSVSQDNFLGTGKRVSAAFNNSRVNRVLSFGYTNPYYTIDGVSRGFNLYYRKTDAAEANLSDYNLDRYGGDVSFGIPLSEFNRLRASIGIENTKVLTNSDTPTRIREILAEQGTNKFLNYEGRLSWSHDTRNRAVFADRGMLNRASLDVALPGSDWEFYKLTLRHQTYFPLARNWTLSATGEVGVGDGYGQDSDIPFWENFFAGGVRSVRGFKSNSLGPRDPETDDPIGGSLKTIGGLSLFMPPPFGDELGNIRLEAFLDFGTVYDQPKDFDVKELRYSTGLGVQWLSPFGPLSISYAFPLNKKSGDEDEPVQFTFGTAF